MRIVTISILSLNFIKYGYSTEIMRTNLSFKTTLTDAGMTNPPFINCPFKGHSESRGKLDGLEKWCQTVIHFAL